MFIQSSLDKNINKLLVKIADNTHYIITVSPYIVKNNSYLLNPRRENKLRVLIVYHNITLG